MLDDGVILSSQANLVASTTADWSPEAREAARLILSRIAAEETARLSREVRALLPRVPAGLVEEAAAAFGATSPLGPPVDGRLALHCPTKSVAALADWLIARGAGQVVVTPLAYVFSARNALHDRLVARLR